MVKPLLLYNAATLDLTPNQLEPLNTLHRKHLRIILKVFYPNYISNSELYHRIHSRRISSEIRELRWKLFGHILRLAKKPNPDNKLEEEVPAYLAMLQYVNKLENRDEWKSYRGRVTTTYTLLNDDMKHAYPDIKDPEYKKLGLHLPKARTEQWINTEWDLRLFRVKASNRNKWSDFVQEIVRRNDQIEDELYEKKRSQKRKQDILEAVEIEDPVTKNQRVEENTEAMEISENN